MADKSYQPTTYKKQGGGEKVVADGGIITVESGGAVNVESGGEVEIETGGVIDLETGAILKSSGGKIQLGATALSATCLYLGAGTSAAYIDTATADAKFIELRFSNSATSGDNRGMYLRLKMTGAGGGGEALRAFTNAHDVACGTAHGAHISLSFASTGSITGLGAGSRSTLHVPDQAQSGGTYCGAMAEIWSDGASSDISGATEHSILRLVNSGNATGQATVSNAIALVGASATMVVTGTVGGTEKGLRILIDGVVHYITLGTTCT